MEKSFENFVILVEFVNIFLHIFPIIHVNDEKIFLTQVSLLKYSRDIEMCDTRIALLKYFKRVNSKESGALPDLSGLLSIYITVGRSK